MPDLGSLFVPWPMQDPRVSRRELLRAGSLYGAGFWLALHLPVPAASADADPMQPLALSAGEWRTVEAVTGRILPTDHEPGAVEAGCVAFIDRALAHDDAGALSLYRFGVRGLDAVSRRRFEKPFARLSPVQQDAVLAAVQDGSAEGWPEGPVPSPVFFETVRAHTVIAFLADPKHGGNRGYAGWKVVGYPGPRHAGGGYTPEQMRGTAPITTAWGEALDAG